MINIGGAHHRQVFAQFGAALFQCQALEGRLSVLLALAESPGPHEGTREDLQALLDLLHRRPLGVLIARYCKSGLIPDGYEPRLAEALALRNHLAHHYFSENMGKLASPEGRNEMIVELNQHAASMREVEQEIAVFTKQWHTKHGITDEAIKAAEEEIMRGYV